MLLQAPLCLALLFFKIALSVIDPIGHSGTYVTTSTLQVIEWKVYKVISSICSFVANVTYLHKTECSLEASLL
jgi:hypothetical protein